MTSAETPTQQAYELVMDHAELDHLGKLHHRLHGGRESARALGLSALDGEQWVDLSDSYDHGWSVSARATGHALAWSPKKRLRA